METKSLVTLGLAAALLVLGAAGAQAAPFRWQTPAGEPVDLNPVPPETAGQPARLEVRPATGQWPLPEPVILTLSGATSGEVLQPMALGEELVLRGAAHAWRLRWRGDQLQVVASVGWQAPALPPAWARARQLTSYQAAFDELTGALRLAGSVQGMERFFGEGAITLRTRIPGHAPLVERLSGTELLARWRDAGFPLVRGPRKAAGPRCASLPAALDERFAQARYGKRARTLVQQLALVCFDAELKISRVEVSGALAPPTIFQEPPAPDPKGGEAR